MHEGFWFAMACAGIEFFLHQKTGPGLESTSFFPHGFHGSPPFCCSGFVGNFFGNYPTLHPPQKRGELNKKYAFCCYGNLVVIGCLFHVRSMTAQTTCVTDSTSQV